MRGNCRHGLRHAPAISGECAKNFVNFANQFRRRRCAAIAYRVDGAEVIFCAVGMLDQLPGDEWHAPCGIDLLALDNLKRLQGIPFVQEYDFVTCLDRRHHRCGASRDVEHRDNK